MKINFNKKNIKKIIIITLCSLFGIALVIFISGYLTVHSYISKMNIVELEEEVVYAEDAIYEEEEDYELEPSEADEDIDLPEEKSASNTVDLPAVEAVEVSKTEAKTEESMKQNTYNKDIEELEEAISRNMRDNSTPIMEDKDVLNVLLIGSDTRNVKERGRSDAMILISINRETEKIVATSFLRDIYLQIPGKKNNRINTAYSSGGTKLLFETIEKNFKIKIDKYAAVDFQAFAEIVDVIGGVTIDVTEEEIAYINKSVSKSRDRLSVAGPQLLNGKQALGYVRIRYIGTDFGRTARQRAVLEQIFNKIKKLNMSQLNNLLKEVLPLVTTNFKEGEIFEQILNLPDYLGYDMEQWSIPMKGTYKNLTINRMEVLGIDFNKNIKELYNRIYATD